MQAAKRSSVKLLTKEAAQSPEKLSRYLGPVLETSHEATHADRKHGAIPSDNHTRSVYPRTDSWSAEDQVGRTADVRE